MSFGFLLEPCALLLKIVSRQVHPELVLSFMRGGHQVPVVARPDEGAVCPEECMEVSFLRGAVKPLVCYRIPEHQHCKKLNIVVYAERDRLQPRYRAIVPLQSFRAHVEPARCVSGVVHGGERFVRLAKPLWHVNGLCRRDLLHLLGKNRVQRCVVELKRVVNQPQRNAHGEHGALPGRPRECRISLQLAVSILHVLQDQSQYVGQPSGHRILETINGFLVQNMVCVEQRIGRDEKRFFAVQIPREDLFVRLVADQDSVRFEQGDIRRRQAALPGIRLPHLARGSLRAEEDSCQKAQDSHIAKSHSHCS
ncbi:MAG: hypothetical protein A4E68_01427 [Syntrophaceae bacterium PtaB.Bin095]|nr:MAG: hypothetical protein A4E68_01427 [Syntrophaceae bacterium PtaB.Bin095]